MKTKPILFNTDMVQAILNGSKTQTRRVVKPQPSETGVSAFNDGEHPQMKCPYGKVGDVLWVREAFAEDDDTPKVIYKADHTKEVQNYVKWKPSIRMPKIACRLFLQITNIRVERLQDITEQDAKNEGAKHDRAVGYGQIGGSHREGFINLWQSINGEQSWQQNPWVWVIEFKKINKPANF